MNNDFIVRIQEIDDNKYTIWAVVEETENIDDERINYYDVFDDKGFCINEGDPFYNLPNKKELEEYIKQEGDDNG